MAASNTLYAQFNRGKVDKRFLTRTDVKRIAFAAETQTNWIPRSGGSMTIRPGLEYVGATYGNARAKHIPFERSDEETAIIELTSGSMRVRVNEAIVERYSVSTTITNGTFDTDLTGWTDADEAGATSAWATGGYLGLTGTRFNAAIRRQQVSVALADRGAQHGLRVVINRGPVSFKIGTSSGADDLVSEIVLGTGTHSLAFTPNASSFWVDFSARSEWQAQVDSIAVESAGDMVIPTPWQSSDLENIRFSQSVDIVYVSCYGYQQRKIERRGVRSWSVVLYEPTDGPFLPINTSTLTLTPGAQTGDTTLTASRSYFKTSHVGALFKIRSIGQKRTATLTAESQWSDSIRVVGVDNNRVFQINISGTWSATITLQRSIDDESSWTDVTTYSSNQSNINFDDSLDNTVAYYRIGIDTGDYTSGTAAVTLTYSGGGFTGTCRVRSFTSATVVNVSILQELGQTTASDAWYEGVWSEKNGFPSSVAHYEGRIWWGGNDRIIGSISDAYESFDDEEEGDSAPISRTLGSGPVAFVNWILPVQRLLIGTRSAEHSIRSSTLDEIITPTNFNIKKASTQGSDRVPAVQIDTKGVFVQASGQKVFALSFDLSSNDYESEDLTLVVPDNAGNGFIAAAVQRQPDTRVHFVRSDGTVAMLIYSAKEEMTAFVDVETDGEIEDVFVMSGDREDIVYYCVKRTINGSVVRYLEKWALESECSGDTFTCLADSFRMFVNNPASATVSGLAHLEGESVVCWADGMCLRDSSGAIATFTVSGGSITLTNAGSSYSATLGVVGLAYTARFKSGKLPYAANLKSIFGQNHRISQIGLICTNTHNQGLLNGRDFSNMQNLPKTVNGTTAGADDIHSYFDQTSITFPGNAGVDSRLCLEARAPRPVTVTAAVLGVESYETKP